MKRENRKLNQRTRAGVYIVLATAAMGAVLMTGFWGAAAHADSGGRVCSNVTLRGAYGLKVSGVRAVPPFLGGGTEMFIGTAVRTYDGNGGFSESGGSFHGQVVGVLPDPGGVTGTYTVNPDCSGRSTVVIPGVPFPIEHSFVIVDAGKAVKEAVMSPVGNIVSVELNRQ